MTPPLLTDERLAYIEREAHLIAMDSDESEQALEDCVAELIGLKEYIRGINAMIGGTGILAARVKRLLDDRAELLRLREERTRLEKAIRTAIYELSGLVEHPDDECPDWMPALENSNSADAECLQKAWSALRGASSLDESALPTLKEGEQPL